MSAITESYREKRDELHKEIQDLKEKRDKLNEDVEKESEALSKIKNGLFKEEYKQLKELRRELRNLEKRQMTSVLTVQEEKNIVKNISDINKKIEKIELKIFSNDSFREHREKIRELKLEADKYHYLILELSAKATEYHRMYMEGDE